MSQEYLLHFLPKLRIRWWYHNRDGPQGRVVVVVREEIIGWVLNLGLRNLWDLYLEFKRVII